MIFQSHMFDRVLNTPLDAFTLSCSTKKKKLGTISFLKTPTNNYIGCRQTKISIFGEILRSCQTLLREKCLNTDQEKLGIWTLFTQCIPFSFRIFLNFFNKVTSDFNRAMCRFIRKCQKFLKYSHYG